MLVALRKGSRVEERIMPTKVGINQRVKKEEAIKFAESLGIKVE